jgi:hypothetical protein
MKTTKDILIEARELIAKGWTQGANARDLQGKIVDESDEAAVCFCVYGAISRAECCDGYSGSARDLFADANGVYLIDAWNDAPERTKPEVLAAFQKAIDSLEVGS